MRLPTTLLLSFILCTPTYSQALALFSLLLVAGCTKSQSTALEQQIPTAKSKSPTDAPPEAGQSAPTIAPTNIDLPVSKDQAVAPSKSDSPVANDQRSKAAAKEIDEAVKGFVTSVFTQSDSPAVGNLRIFSADHLASEYVANEVAADKRFEGRRFVVSGEIEKIGKDIMLSSYVVLKGEGWRDVQCTFADDENPKLFEEIIAAGVPAIFNRFIEGISDMSLGTHQP